MPRGLEEHLQAFPLEKTGAHILKLPAPLLLTLHHDPKSSLLLLCTSVHILPLKQMAYEQICLSKHLFLVATVTMIKAFRLYVVYSFHPAFQIEHYLVSTFPCH